MKGKFESIFIQVIELLHDEGFFESSYFYAIFTYLELIKIDKHMYLLDNVIWHTKQAKCVKRSKTY